MTVARNLHLLLLIGVVGPTRPQVNCNDQSEMLSAQGACFTAQGLDVPLPSVDFPVLGKQTVGYLNVVMKLIPDSVCRRPESFRRTLKCFEDISRDCPNWSSFSTKILSQVLDTLCINDRDVNLACVAEKFNQTMQCEFQKAYETILSNNSITNKKCRLFKNQNDCQRSLYRSCGCATVRRYEQIYLDIFDRALCPQSPSSTSRVRCDVNINNIVGTTPFLGNINIIVSTTPFLGNINNIVGTTPFLGNNNNIFGTTPFLGNINNIVGTTPFLGNINNIVGTTPFLRNGITSSRGMPVMALSPLLCIILFVFILE